MLTTTNDFFGTTIPAADFDDDDVAFWATIPTDFDDLDATATTDRFGRPFLNAAPDDTDDDF